ncbi:MAG: pyruvate kinase, partial [Dehalococcoidales bacterium]|nr:pyruvate kinase [Dehalococcoidales bacterium]
MSHLRQWGQHTKIVCTLGPATGTRSIIEQLIKAGMDVARLNLSHGSLPDHARLIEEVRNASLRLNSRVAVLLDLPGPKYRTGKLKTDSVVLKKGSQITITTRDIEGDGAIIPINLPTLPMDVKPGSRILIDDGAMKLKVIEKKDTEILCRVIVGGTLTQGRGVVVPG